MIVRLILVFAWTLLVLPIQLVLIRLKGNAKQRLPMIYWAGMARCLGVTIETTGTIATDPGRPILFVANHSSWLDIVVLGAVLPGCFVAKGEVARWPVISAIAHAGRTIFVSRSRDRAPAERRDLAARLAAGDNLILFPEGTTSDGARVLPFHTGFLALAGIAAKPVIQPVTLVYDQMDGLPICRRNRPLIAWYGDMEIAPHYARLGRHRWRARIVLDAPVDPALGRKAFGAALEADIAARAADLRQGRAVK